MRLRPWARALQVAMLPVGVGPVLVGSALGANWAGRLDVPVRIAAGSSILAIQMGANLQKGLVESAALGDAPATPQSAFVFDAGAALQLGLDEARLRRVLVAFHGAGALFGLAVVLLVRELWLLALGAFFAYSYSVNSPGTSLMNVCSS